jgi:hypothetical protein
VVAATLSGAARDGGRGNRREGGGGGYVLPSSLRRSATVVSGATAGLLLEGRKCCCQGEGGGDRRDWESPGDLAGIPSQSRAEGTDHSNSGLSVNGRVRWGDAIALLPLPAFDVDATGSK